MKNTYLADVRLGVKIGEEARRAADLNSTVKKNSIGEAFAYTTGKTNEEDFVRNFACEFNERLLAQQQDLGDEQEQHKGQNVNKYFGWSKHDEIVFEDRNRSSISVCVCVCVFAFMCGAAG